MRHGFNSGHMKGGVYTNRKRTAKGLIILEMGNGPINQGRACGIPPGGEDPGWIAIPSEPGSDGYPLVIDTWRWS